MRTANIHLAPALLALAAAASAGPAPPAMERLPDTQPLTWSDDIASRLVAGVDRFLLREIGRTAAQRRREGETLAGRELQAWRDQAREKLLHALGMRDPAVPFDAPEVVGRVDSPAPGSAGRGRGFRAVAIRWPAFGEVHGEGLLLLPTGRAPVADVVAVPDADVLPEALAGLAPGVPPESQYARRLAESGCRVVVPFLIDRKVVQAGAVRAGRGGLSNREFLYRSSFELGRHLVGYELQKIAAALEWLARSAPERGGRAGVIGWGEGGLLALYTAATSPRAAAVCVSGYFGDRARVWEEPIERNLFGLLAAGGDAEIALLGSTTHLIVEAARGPELTLPSPGAPWAGAPARLRTPALAEVRAETERAARLAARCEGRTRVELVVSGDGAGPPGSEAALRAFVRALAPRARLAAAEAPPEPRHARFEPEARAVRQMREIDRHNQQLLAESPYVRQEFMRRLDFSSPAAYQKSAQEYRRIFYDRVIGRFDLPRLPFNARTRKAYDTEMWTGYEVVLDVFDDVIAYGVLLLPRGMKEGEKRPVVVCQHGLEGRPQDVISGNKDAYHDFAAKLAERGFITFAPQNLYLFGDRFRTLQRKANAIGRTLFSVITPQHQQILDWLKTLPNVDPERIAFYGLSYGGKTAMRAPAIVTDYCLSICSADFNEWVWKNASTRSPYSYVWTGEYEIFEFDLGSTFNYAEMAALIAPRPFMVERGHFDGVAPDEAVAYEFAKVRHLYQARLGIGDRCEIEWFVGPHTINGRGTFDFLHRHLRWPKR